MGNDEKKPVKGGEVERKPAESPKPEKKSVVAGKPEIIVKPKEPAKPPQLSGQTGHTKKRRSLFKGQPRKQPVDTLASRTGTDPVVFAALKRAYSWTDKTRLTHDEFLRLRDSWLNSRPEEV